MAGMLLIGIGGALDGDTSFLNAAELAAQAELARDAQRAADSGHDGRPDRAGDRRRRVRSRGAHGVSLAPSQSTLGAEGIVRTGGALYSPCA